MDFRKQIITYENVLPPEMFAEAQQYLNRPLWSINQSDPNYQGHKLFWGMQLQTEKFFNHDVFQYVKKLIKDKDVKIKKILANAQSTLQDGTPHCDTTNPKGRTFILYANETWDYQWGGQTIFFDRIKVDNHEKKDTDEIVNSSGVHHVMPIPNTAVYFPSNMVHYAVGPHRDFYGIRYTIAYHLIKN